MPQVQSSYRTHESLPTFALGVCPPCKFPFWIEQNLRYDDNTSSLCPNCGRTTNRRALVQEALAELSPIAWGLVGSDFVVWDTVSLTRDDYVTYNVVEPVAKWLREVALPVPGLGVRYVPSVVAFDNFVMLRVDDTLQYSAPPENPPPQIEATWYRFALRDLRSVPAWRQSLFAAAMMIDENPSASLVLVAAGFEAFFSETMSVRWTDKGLRAQSFRSIIRNQNISNLVDWLPGAVDLPSLRDGPNDLYGRWKTLVNERRNDVMHRGNVHFTSAEARESLRCALECIAFIDELGLMRPHAYFR